MEHIDVAETTANLALLYEEEGYYEKAESEFRDLVKAASGDIVIRLPEGSKPSGTLRTASGEIHVNVSSEKGKHATVLTGDGAEIDVTAASGDVTVTTAPKG